MERKEQTGRWRIKREALEHFIEAREKTKRKEG